jgi:hypothetical protein
MRFSDGGDAKTSAQSNAVAQTVHDTPDRQAIA